MLAGLRADTNGPAQDVEDHVVYMVDLLNASAVAEVVVGIQGIVRGSPCTELTRMCPPSLDRKRVDAGASCVKGTSFQRRCAGMPGDFGDTPYKRPALQATCSAPESQHRPTPNSFCLHLVRASGRLKFSRLEVHSFKTPQRLCASL